MKNKVFSPFLLALNGLLATAAWAQTSEVHDGFLVDGVSSTGPFKPKSFEAGGFRITPSATVGFGRDDNISLQPDSSAVSSSFVNVAPQVVADAAYRAHRYQLGYLGNYTRYSSYSAADTTNHDLFARGSHEFTARSSLRWRLDYRDHYDSLGTDLNRLRNDPDAEPDRYDLWKASALYGYGAPGAQGRLELGASLEDQEYKNNRNYVLKALDVTTGEVTGRFYYRVAPRTQLVAEYRRTEKDYETQNQDNTEQRYLLGAVWEATAATTGLFKIGHLRKDFESGGSRRDFSGMTWEGSVRWEPLTYSRFEFTLGRATGEALVTDADYLLNRINMVEWTHNWTSYLQSSVKLARNSSKYVGTPRRDDYDILGLGVKYTFRSWLRTGLAYEYSKRDSTDPLFDYKRNLVTAYAEVGF